LPSLLDYPARCECPEERRRDQPQEPHERPRPGRQPRPPTARHLHSTSPRAREASARSRRDISTGDPSPAPVHVDADHICHRGGRPNAERVRCICQASRSSRLSQAPKATARRGRLSHERACRGGSSERPSSGPPVHRRAEVIEECEDMRDRGRVAGIVRGPPDRQHLLADEGGASRPPTSPQLEAFVSMSQASAPASPHRKANSPASRSAGRVKVGELQAAARDGIRHVAMTEDLSVRG